MINEPIIRKPKMHFDTTAQPPNVTFDDGKHVRRNLPWHDYVETRWDHATAAIIKIIIGDWRIELRGHNLAPLFQAIEDNSLARVKAQPALKEDAARVIDTFVTDVVFTRLSPGPELSNPNQEELNLGG
ncbi:MAG: hypothetical protein QM760_16050 [Nibricoccus sp.]